MDSLTISPSSLRRATYPEDMFLGDVFEWNANASCTPLMSLPNHSHLSPPESFDLHTPLPKANKNVQKTPIRKRAASSASLSSFSPIGGYDKGLITPISMSNTPATYWAGQKLEFMTPTQRSDDFIMNTPLATPGALAPTSPLFKSPTTTSSSSSSGNGGNGTNPFYCLPLCMRSNTEPVVAPSMISPDVSEDFEFKAKAANAAEEALATFEEPTRERAYSESDVAAPEKPFSCPHCTKCFRRMEHLRRHTKIHTKERPFSCEIAGCGRKFSRSDNLKAHMKTHAKPSGRNIYVEGLEFDEVPATPKRRKVE